MAGTYEIRVRGHLHGEFWADWLGGLDLRLEPSGETVAVGPLADQAALHGVLARVRDLGLELISVQQFSPDAGSG